MNLVVVEYSVQRRIEKKVSYLFYTVVCVRRSDGLLTGS